MRTDDIKKKYLKSGVFKDGEQFSCGDQIAYEVEMDIRAMKAVREYLDDFIKYKNPIKTFGDAALLNARDLLHKRIVEFDE